MKKLLLVWLLAVTLAADPQVSSTSSSWSRGGASTERSARQRTTELTKTSEVIQKVVQAAIQSASNRRAYRNRTRSAETTTTPRTVFLRPSADKSRTVYHSSYKNSSGVIQLLPTIRDDVDVGRSQPGSAPAQDVSKAYSKAPRLRKYPRKLSGNATTFSPGTTRATPTPGVSTATLPLQQGATARAEASSINNNIALKILKRPSTTVEVRHSVTTPPTPPSTVFQPPYVSISRGVKLGGDPGPRRLSTSSVVSSTHIIYSLTPLRADDNRRTTPTYRSPGYELSRPADGTKHTVTGNITLDDSHIKIAHISPKALSSIATSSTTDAMKLFSVTIRTNNSNPGNVVTTEKILQTSPLPRILVPSPSFTTEKHQLRTNNALSQRSKELASTSSTAKHDRIRVTTTRSIPVLSVKLNATRETSHELAQKPSQVSDDDGNSLVPTSPTVSAGNILVGQGTTVEVSWKQSVTKSTTTPPRTNSIIETTLLSEAQNPEEFFKLLHDMTSSTYKRNITFGNFNSFYKSEPRNKTSEYSGRIYSDIQRVKQDGAEGQIQYSGISNSVVVPDVSESMDETEMITKPYASKTSAVYASKIHSTTNQAQTSGRPVTWSSTQGSVQQRSTARTVAATPGATRSARRQVFMFRTLTSANEIQRSSESGTSEVTFSGGSRATTRPWTSAGPNNNTSRSTVQGATVSSSRTRSRNTSAGRDRRVTTLPPETTGRFFGWLAALQVPSTARKTTRDAKIAGNPEEKSQPQSQPSRMQRIFGAMQTVADALMEVPRQIWMLPIRFGLYPLVNRVQEEVPAKVRFPCAVPSPGPPPTSVHRLRPGDIRVVAALGDSITAANGALATSDEDTRLNYRGVSAMAGGQEHWRKYLTLPNILKEFNPRLVGYSLGTSDTLAGLNVAESGALDDQLLQQARTLVNRVHADPYVDVDKDWKLVNVLIGGNDICNEYCFVDGSKDSPSGHRQNLEVALDYLQTHLPRTFVNLIHVPNMVLLRNLTNVPFSCYMKQLVLCSCLFGSSERAKAESVSAVLRGYWDAERKVASLERYDTDNFTVVLQPFFVGVRAPSSIPTLFGRAADLSYFAPDCFHLSQKGNSLVAGALWNNMLEPVGNKSYGWQPLLTKFRCPSEEAPFLFTARNSHAYLSTGRQDVVV